MGVIKDTINEKAQQDDDLVVPVDIKALERIRTIGRRNFSFCLFFFKCTMYRGF